MTLPTGGSASVMKCPRRSAWVTIDVSREPTMNA
jgi:hypothetical protein